MTSLTVLLEIDVQLDTYKNYETTKYDNLSK